MRREHMAAYIAAANPTAMASSLARLDAERLDAAYQRARADALANALRKYVGDACDEVGDCGMLSCAALAMPTERPADWTPPKEPTP